MGMTNRNEGVFKFHIHLNVKIFCNYKFHSFEKQGLECGQYLILLICSNMALVYTCINLCGKGNKSAKLLMLENAPK